MSSDSSAFGDFSQYDLPPGMRSARQSTRATSNLKVEDFFSQGVNHYDIPAFLRKEVSSGKASARQLVWSMDVEDGRLYNHTIEYEGLTPLGTYEWVRHKAVKEWPTTYSELLEIGVPAAIVDWLELLIARENKADKVSVIASFLYAFISPTVEHVLASAISDFQASFKDPDNFVVSHDLNEIKLDALVFADVIKSMEHAVDGSWPNCMFDMELV